MMMSQLTHFAAGHADPNLRRVMVIHQQGSEWRTVLMSRDDKSGRITIADHQSFTNEESEKMIGVVESCDADAVVRILPGGTVVSRSISVPRMEDSALYEVLDLQAEAVLPTGTAVHRRAVCVLPWVDRGDDEYEAVAMAWPGREPDDDVDFFVGDQPLRYAPLVSCFTELLAGAAPIEQATNAFVGYLDRKTGTFDILIRHNGASVFRTLRFDSTNSDWIARLERDLAETTVSAGMNTTELDSWIKRVVGEAARCSPVLIVDERFHQVMINKWADDIDLRDDSLWGEFAPSILAGCGLMGPRSQLFRLLANPPEEKRNPFVEWLHWLDQPARSASILIIAVLLFALVPLGSSWGRYQILQARIGDADAVAKQAEQSRDEAQFYELLNKKRWPMTKLLADISGSAPYPVKIQEITIDSESGQVRLKGTAPVADDLSVFREVLGTTGIFDQIRVPRSETKANFVQFEMSFGVSDPAREVKRAFTDSFAHVLYGDDADKVQPGKYEINNPSARRMPGGGNRSSRKVASSLRKGTAGKAGDSEQSESKALFSSPGDDSLSSLDGSSSKKRASNIPPPLTTKQIGEMTYQQSISSALKRTKVMYDPFIDEPTKTRLRDELRLLTLHSQAVKPGKNK